MSTARADPVILFSSSPDAWARYRGPLRAALDAAGVGLPVVTAAADPGAVRYVVYSPASGLTDFTPFTGLRAVLSLWAGVETIAPNPTLRVPLCRMVEPGLTEGMVEWAVGHTLRHHLGLDAHILGQDGVWREDVVPPLARARRVTVLGLGVLGRAVAEALAALNFDVAGWSRTPKALGFKSFSGAGGLRDALRRAEIVIVLLPQTPATENILDAAALDTLPRGAVVINPGRGALIDDAALIAALDRGHVAHATLDVFRVEPLPPAHPFWSHPRVTVTPHIASATRPQTAVQSVAETIRRGEAGAGFLHAVDRDLGY